MTNTKLPRLKNLGEVEQAVMDYIWTQDEVTAESCREALASSRPMKDSTIRTVLRRLEEKGYLTHEIEGRTFVYRASSERHGPQNVCGACNSADECPASAISPAAGCACRCAPP